jgi:hypothetical protein
LVLPPPCSFFLETLLVLLIFLSLLNTVIPEMIGLMAASFAKVRTVLRDYFYIFNWLLMVLRGTLALQSSTMAFLIHF